ncbi:alpha/beta hydrolase [Variovorax sp. J22R133]|uniref:alpha/beta fold hydrolase n=1 Tax=Variovorax brevis TaxID=3053503 RepID=UPI002576ACDE|nr:alpha/beta hydrolase [Variovorax sp. J22R133]MDM0116491.1 alpha/beta hydrolase [Variovorax sp. J22R133]
MQSREFPMPLNGGQASAWRALDMRLQAGRVPADAPTLLLDGDAVMQLLATAAEGRATLPSCAQLERARDQGRLRLVAAYHDFAGACSLQRFEEILRAAVQAHAGSGTEICCFILAHGLDGGDALGAQQPAALDAWIESAVAPVFEARRRFDGYFGRQPLRLPAQPQSVHLLALEAVVQCLAMHTSSAGDGVHLLHAEALCTETQLLRHVAEQVDIPLADDAPASDRFATLLVQGLRHAQALHGLDAHALQEASADNAIHLIALPAPRIDLRVRVASCVGVHRAAHEDQRAAAARLRDMPGLHLRRLVDPEHAYWRVGDSGPALVIVNAFGLAPDFWQPLVRDLCRHFVVLALGPVNEDAPHGLHRSCHDAPDALASHLRAVRAMLAAEGVGQCHVASWCGGAKFAIELARALPAQVLSLSLLSPSFAGIEDDGGSDSAYETSLHTMCKLVERMPQSADSMARSMLALMKKREGAADTDAGALLAMPDANTLPWLHAPFASAENMIDYSRQLLNFRAHTPLVPPAGAPLEVPMLLVTGELDETTSAARAQSLCRKFGGASHFELQSAGHYLIHQNSGLVAQLLRAFMAGGEQVQAPHPRFRRVEPVLQECLVSGEI